MTKHSLLITGGTVIFPEQNKAEKLNIAISDGKIAAMGVCTPDAVRVIDADGLYISPGFIDSHIHDEEADGGEGIEKALLRQGVTTAIAGNCGCGPLAENILPFRQNPWLNLGYLTGHTKLREAAGVTDIYAAAGEKEIEQMKLLLDKELEGGSFGVSIGLEYLPNTSLQEIEALLEVVARFENRWVPIHIRKDGPKAVDAVDEVLALAEKWPVRIQLSHLGSMAGFGQLGKVLEHVENAKSKGADVTFDCYPYSAFCTHLGSAVFDPGFEERWGKGLESLEIASGPYRGKRLSEEDLYNRLRKEDPETFIVAHVIKQDEVELCLSHPDCAIASDGALLHGHGHPRAAGTFPRAIRMLVNKGVSWPEAIRKCTSLPANMNWLDKGVIKEGADADLVIFDGGRLKDNATFADDLLPPDGIEWVIIGGIPAVRGKEILGGAKGKLLSRS